MSVSVYSNATRDLGHVSFPALFRVLLTGRHWRETSVPFPNTDSPFDDHSHMTSWIQPCNLLVGRSLSRSLLRQEYHCDSYPGCKIPTKMKEWKLTNDKSEFLGVENVSLIAGSDFKQDNKLSVSQRGSDWTVCFPGIALRIATGHNCTRD